MGMANPEPLQFTESLMHPRLNSIIKMIEAIGPGSEAMAENFREYQRSAWVLPPGHWEEHEWRGYWTPQCRATTKAGNQCQRHIFNGQSYAYDDSGAVYLPKPQWDMYVAGQCEVHRRFS
jgi:hypothetical protein